MNNLTTMTYLIKLDQNFETYEVTTEKLRKVGEAMDFDTYEELADFVTGLNCDTYADLAGEALENYDNIEEALEDEDLRRAETWHRILNLDLGDEEIRKVWVECNTEMMEDDD